MSDFEVKPINGLYRVANFFMENAQRYPPTITVSVTVIFITIIILLVAHIKRHCFRKEKTTKRIKSREEMAFQQAMDKLRKLLPNCLSNKASVEEILYYAVRLEDIEKIKLIFEHYREDINKDVLRQPLRKMASLGKKDLLKYVLNEYREHISSEEKSFYMNFFLEHCLSLALEKKDWTLINQIICDDVFEVDKKLMCRVFEEACKAAVEEQKDLFFNKTVDSLPNSNYLLPRLPFLDGIKSTWECFKKTLKFNYENSNSIHPILSRLINKYSKKIYDEVFFPLYCSNIINSRIMVNMTAKKDNLDYNVLLNSIINYSPQTTVLNSIIRHKEKIQHNLLLEFYDSICQFFDCNDKLSTNYHEKIRLLMKVFGYNEENQDLFFKHLEEIEQAQLSELYND